MAKHHNPQSLAPNILTQKEMKQQLAAAQLAHASKQNEEQFTIDFDPETYEPCHDLLLVEILTSRTRDDAASKIVIPDTATKPVKDRTKARLVVRRVGPGYHTDYGFWVEQKRSPGELILIPPTGGMPLPDREDGREFLTCRQNEVMAVIGRLEEEPTIESLVKEHGIEN